MANTYVCGDIHGMYDLLIKSLNDLNFNYEADILYCTGDLIDRGPDSYKVLQLIKEPWFRTVRGNHEQMLIENFDPIYSYSSRQLHYQNGGAWFFDITNEQAKECFQLVSALPLHLDFELNGKKIGIIHADPPYTDWNLIKDFSEINKVQQQLIWGRTKISSLDDSIIKNIDYVFLGHTILDTVITLGNCIYIDTGAYHYNNLTIIKLNDVIH